MRFLKESHRKIINCFYKFFLILLLITLIYTIYLKFIKKELITMLGKYGFLVVLTRKYGTGNRCRRICNYKILYEL